MITFKNEKAFNKWFSIVLLSLMVVAILFTTVFKLGQPGTNVLMLLVAAFGSIMGICSTVSSANGIIWTFFFGILDVSIYCWISADNAIWGTFFLHILYFLPMQFVGLWQWSKRGASGTKKEVKARALTGKQRLLLVAASLVVFAAVYTILYIVKMRTVGPDFERSRVLLDALATTCNLAGQVLMSLAFYEQWYFWLLVNLSSIFLWGGIMTTDASSSYTVVMFIKYCFYFVNALNGLRIWKSNIF